MRASRVHIGVILAFHTEDQETETKREFLCPENIGLSKQPLQLLEEVQLGVKVFARSHDCENA